MVRRGPERAGVGTVGGAMALGRSWLRMRWVAAALAFVGSVALAPAVHANAALTPYPGGTWSPPPATYSVLAVKNVFVPMNDGVNLVADVYYPATKSQKAKGSFPVLLTQTPYTLSIGLTGATST